MECFFKVLITAILEKYLQFFQSFCFFSGTRASSKIDENSSTVFGVNGIVINILMSPALAIF